MRKSDLQNKYDELTREYEILENQIKAYIKDFERSAENVKTDCVPGPYCEACAHEDQVKFYTGYIVRYCTCHKCPNFVKKY